MKLSILLLSLFVAMSAHAGNSEIGSSDSPTDHLSNFALFTANDSMMVGNHQKECFVGVLQIFRDGDRLYIVSSNREPQIQRILMTESEKQQLARFGDSGSSFSIEREGRRISLKLDTGHNVPSTEATITEADGSTRNLLEGSNGTFHLGCDK